MRRHIVCILFLLVMLVGCRAQTKTERTQWRGQRREFHDVKRTVGASSHATVASVAGPLAPYASSLPSQLSDADSAAIGLSKDDTIFTLSARTVNFNGQSVIGRFGYMKATGVYDGNQRKSDPLKRELKVATTTLQAVFGINEDVTLSLALPYQSKTMKTTVQGRRVTLDTEGIGDLTVMGKWRFYKDQGVDKTTEISALLGVELPTGDDNDHDEGMKLPAPLQLGSGSVDGIVGAAFTHLWDGGRWLLNADTIFKLNTQANGYRFGNVLRWDVGMQYRVYPKRYKRSDQLTVNAILELNSQYAGKDHTAGPADAVTGGYKVFLSPGLQAILTEHWLLETGIQIPVYRNLNGPQLAEDFKFLVGFRWRF